MKVKVFKKDKIYSFNYSKFKEQIGEDENLEKMDGTEIQVLGKFSGRLLYHNSNIRTDTYRYVTPRMCDERGDVCHI